MRPTGIPARRENPAPQSRLTRAGTTADGGESSGTTAGWTAFMGWLGLISASFNFLLIMAEELVIVWVKLRA